MLILCNYTGKNLYFIQLNLRNKFNECHIKIHQIDKDFIIVFKKKSYQFYIHHEVEYYLYEHYFFRILLIKFLLSYHFLDKSLSKK